MHFSKFKNVFKVVKIQKYITILNKRPNFCKKLLKIFNSFISGFIFSSCSF